MGSVPSIIRAYTAPRNAPLEHLAFRHLHTQYQNSCTIPTIVNTKSFSRWYWTPSVQVTDSWEVPQVQKYDPAPYLTMRVFLRAPGTVIANVHLWVEQVFLLAVLFLIGIIIFSLPNEIGEWIWNSTNEKEKDIQSVCDNLSTMASFMLTFFTSLNVARWWRLRTDGIGNLFEACTSLTLLLSRWVTRDEHVLSSIRRYARASLMLIFMDQRGYGDDLQILVNRGLVTEEEMTLLEKVRYSRSEAIWQWVMEIIVALRKEGLIPCDHILALIIQAVERGKNGAAICNGQLGTPIPMQYTHFIGFLVKFHNLMVTILMAGLAASLVATRQRGHITNVVWKTMVMPCLYNAILFLNEEIMNPFSGNLMDFPMQKFDAVFEDDSTGYLDAGDNPPSWIKEWKAKGFNAAPHRPSARNDKIWDPDAPLRSSGSVRGSVWSSERREGMSVELTGITSLGSASLTSITTTSQSPFLQVDSKHVADGTEEAS